MDYSLQFKYCEKCKNRLFSPKKGLVCNLTDEKPTFTDTCPQFEVDEKAEKKLELKEQAKAEYVEAETYGMAGTALNGGIIGGIVMMVLAVVWFVAGLVMADRIFFYPPILLVLGIIGLVKGINKRSEQRRKQMASKHVLDRDLLDD